GVVMSCGRIPAGMRRWDLPVPVTVVLVLTSSSVVAEPPETIELSGVVRDFRRAHPDFDINAIDETGHYTGNVALTLPADDRPVFIGSGIKVLEQWRDSGGRPIAPHLYMSAGTGGVIKVSEEPSIHTNAALDTWDSSIGPYGGLNVGPPPEIEQGAQMPDITLPSGLGGSYGDLELDGGAIGSNLHCDDLDITGEVWIHGDLTIYCEDDFTLHTNGSVMLAEGARLSLYVEESITIMPHSTFNANTPKPGLATIYGLGDEGLRISQPHGIVCAAVVLPDAKMEVMPEARFFGTFIGKDLDLRPNAAFHLDTAFSSVVDACGYQINDTAGNAANDSNGLITSSETFDQWYREALGVSLAAAHSITLIRDEEGVYEYLDDEFYPIDGLLYGNERDDHNNFFTYAVEMQFEYEACAGQFVEYRGSDDAWVYVDGKLAMDRNGIAAAIEQVAELDRLGLVDGEIYTLQLFYAHRQDREAILRLRTNIPIWGETVVVEAGWPCD
ncbi:MAG: fibro-slime domain-containing protein, partial [Planctomycetota bacterium]